MSIGRVRWIDLTCDVATIQEEAICVRHWDWSETSQTVSLLTRENGLIRCLAKGSKRDKAPFSGGLEIATLGHMVAIARPNSELVLLTQWDLLRPMHLLRSTLPRFHASMYAIDLIPRLINDHDPHPEIYDALCSVLTTLGESPAESDLSIARLMLWYQWVLLVQIGSRPELRQDVRTGERLDPNAQVFGFHASHGGLTGDPGQNDLSDIWRVRRSTVDLLRRLDEQPELSALSDAGSAELGRAGGLLAMYIRTLVGHDIRSAHAVYPRVLLGR